MLPSYSESLQPLKFLLVQLICKHDDCDECPCDYCTPDVQILYHSDCRWDFLCQTGKTGLIHQIADQCACDAAAELLTERASAEYQSLYTNAGLPVTVVDDIGRHGEAAAEQRCFAKSAQGPQRRSPRSDWPELPAVPAVQ